MRHALRVIEGSRDPEDIFLLATDALAHWFLIEHEAGRKPWHTLLKLKDESEFVDFIGSIRKEGKLKNDDTTLLIIRWAAES